MPDNVRYVPNKPDCYKMGKGSSNQVMETCAPSFHTPSHYTLGVLFNWHDCCLSNVHCKWYTNIYTEDECQTVIRESAYVFTINTVECTTDTIFSKNSQSSMMHASICIRLNLNLLLEYIVCFGHHYKNSLIFAKFAIIHSHWQNLIRAVRKT